MEWTQWLPLMAGLVALLGVWGAIQHRLGRLEARMDSLESRMERSEREQAEARAENIRLHEDAKAENIRLHEDAKAENIRLHEETRAEFRREIRLVLQVLREHTHADGSPATTPVPVDGN